MYIYMELRSFRLDLIEMAIAVAVVVCNVRFYEYTYQLINIEENGQNPVTYWLRQLYVLYVHTTLDIVRVCVCVCGFLVK